MSHTIQITSPAPVATLIKELTEEFGFHPKQIVQVPNSDDVIVFNLSSDEWRKLRNADAEYLFHQIMFNYKTSW